MTDIHESLKPLAVSIDSLTPDPSNARKHDKRNIEAIKASLARFGQTKPIVLHSNGSTIIAGNGTWHAAKELGWTHIAAAKTNLDTAEAVAYGIADNKTAELAEWEDDTLRDLMDALPDDLKLATGFEGDEIAEMLRLPSDEVHEDEVPPTPKEPTTQPGDLWLLGDHRVLCGDSTNPDDIAKLMQGEKAQFGFTSPPYNAGNSQTGAYAGGSAKRTDHKAFYTHDLDNMKSEEYKDFLWNVLGMCAVVLEETAVMGWNTCYNAKSRREYGEVLFSNKNDLKVQETVIWDKGVGMNVAASNVYSRSAEFVFLLSRTEKYTSNQNGGVYWNIWRHSNRDGDNMQNGHGASFPVALPVQAIQQHSTEADIVFEPFAGSGTTLIAAEQLGRKCYGMELEPKYCDVIVQRWENLTGKKAERVPAEVGDASTVES